MTDRPSVPTKRPRGRPRSEQPTVARGLRLTETRWAKLDTLGLDWLNRQIDRARVPSITLPAPPR